MILTLIREQLRTQRSYVIWAATLIAATVAVVAFAMGLGATQQAHAQFGNTLQGHPFEHGAFVIAPGSEAATPPVSSSSQNASMTWEQLRTTVAQAQADGVRAVATASIPLTIVPGDGSPAASRGPLTWNATAVVGDFPWSQVLARGKAPRSGEVVLSPWMAQGLGVDVGDTLRYTVDGSPAGTFKVSGVSYSIGGWTSQEWTPGIYLLADSVAVAAADDPSSRATDPGITGGQPSLSVDLSWAGDYPPLDTLNTTPSFTWGSAGFTSPSTTPWVLAAMLSVGVVVMAFAAGRARAHERVRWSATARALGATRRTVGLASLGEGAAVTVVAGIVGIAAGAAAAWVAHAIRQASTLDAPPIAFSFSAYAVLVAGIVAVVLGGVMAAVPAFLSTRVAPAAALKDVAAIDEVEVSRRVPVWPVVVVAAVLYGILLWAVSATPATPVTNWTAGVTTLALVVTGLAILVEASRRLARLLGARLSRSDRPWALRAGIEMLAHPRQAAALITLHTLTAGSMATWAAVNDANGGFFGDGAYNGLFRGATLGFTSMVGYAGGLLQWRLTLAVLITVHLIGAATFAATRRLGEDDARVASALGLDHAAALKGTAARLTLPSFVGTVIGALGGAVIAGLPLMIDRTNGFTANTPGQNGTMVTALALGVLGIVIMGAVLSAVVALVILRVQVPRRRAHRESAMPVA
ncbi:FtsX-like permease family protein [Demequina lutea]|uniref:ABC3 transporter permease C-terminal domain-containing protein n=1 Tax=Demequina lutea TaxID=431489 RepID=A0A7Y9Z7Q6_9MICO|nr:FtsX-like permease family protein [Demequina lutea]NYI40161.1 hypothetical protein [Demequina lutea]